LGKNLKTLLAAAGLALGLALGPSAGVRADTEIDLGTALNPTPTPVPVAPPSQQAPSIDLGAPPVPQSRPAPQPTVETEPATSGAGAGGETEPAEKPDVVHGMLKMKDIYEAGIDSYKEKDYGQAIRYLKEALRHPDPYTPRYYYAEAAAMLGVIYQFHIIHDSLAYHYYREALRIDPHTRTARRHIGQVRKYRFRKN
jgi:tetratricopeptide (TPR) repeat protein